MLTGAGVANGIRRGLQSNPTAKSAARIPGVSVVNQCQVPRKERYGPDVGETPPVSCNRLWQGCRWRSCWWQSIWFRAGRNARRATGHYQLAYPERATAEHRPVPAHRSRLLWTCLPRQTDVTTGSLWRRASAFADFQTAIWQVLTAMDVHLPCKCCNPYGSMRCG